MTAAALGLVAVFLRNRLLQLFLAGTAISVLVVVFIRLGLASIGIR